MSKLSLNIGLMLTINKVFGILCLLCLCWNREYPGSVQNKSLSSSFKWLPKYSVPGQAKGKAFLEWASTDLSFKYFLHVGVMLTIIKVLLSYSYSAYGNTQAIFKTNQQALHSVECPGMFSSWPKWKWKESLFGGCKKGGHIVRLPICCQKGWKISPFVKFEIILLLLCLLLDPLTNKHCRTWS